MIRTLSLFAFLVVIQACTSIKHYTYDIKLQKPTPSNGLTYEDDTLSLSFTFDPKAISFEFYNKSEDGIKILWDELSMSQNGVAQRVIHKNTGMTRITDLQPPTTIPPKTKMEDELIPSSSVSFVRASGTSSLVIRPIYPNIAYNKKERAKLLKLKGQRIVIFFPYYIRNVYHSKNFEFMVEDIIEKKR